MTEYVTSKLKQADMILIGLGEDFDLVKAVKADKRYLDIKSKVKNSNLLPYIERYLLKEKHPQRRPIYEQLNSMIKDKNYFILTLCQDGVIDSVKFKADRIVKPCGGYTKLQCINQCSKELYNVEEETDQIIRNFAEGRIAESNVELPVCPHCGKTLVFNKIESENYIEEEYLNHWQTYMKWLQGTLNKSFFVLELGAGMKYPSVIRWPFEKIVYLNEKAELFRVHERLYQISDEIKEKGHGICQSPTEFITELSVVN